MPTKAQGPCRIHCRISPLSTCVSSSSFVKLTCTLCISSPSALRWPSRPLPLRLISLISLSLGSMVPICQPKEVHSSTPTSMDRPLPSRLLSLRTSSASSSFSSTPKKPRDPLTCRIFSSTSERESAAPVNQLDASDLHRYGHVSLDDPEHRSAERGAGKG